MPGDLEGFPRDILEQDLEDFKVYTVWSHVDKTMTNQTLCMYIEEYICLQCGFRLQGKSNLMLPGEVQPQENLQRPESELPSFPVRVSSMHSYVWLEPGGAMQAYDKVVY